MASIGLEPILREEMDFESIASANSAKRPCEGFAYRRVIIADLGRSDKGGAVIHCSTIGEVWPSAKVAKGVTDKIKPPGQG